ncbi:hypothetical protein IB238_03410 [Rhizobium sp. ARZ01]|uniref:hypothetical protein n=1 Tax=Rhizobium sp. ARZ01 TaxID=2769313 RepID=UPI00177BB07C|nr:hypothetical protein [Rhizobium sp. ARZ01]MBD9371689.1 hypothetical protein [Rhizobium sp. ARZ01]
MQERPVQDPISENRPLEGRATVVNTSGGSRAGGWAVAAIAAVLVAAGVFYLSGGMGDGVDPNANTSSIQTQVPTPATPSTDGQATGTEPAPQPVQPAPSQPTTGGTGQ